MEQAVPAGVAAPAVVRQAPGPRRLQGVAAPRDIGDVLRLAASLAAQHVHGCQHAGAFVLGQDGELLHEASSDQVGSTLDARQLELGEGPSLESMADGTVVHGCLGVLSPWPRFAVAAAEMGVASALALPLTGTGVVRGVLSCYSGRADAFGSPPATAQLLATLASHGLVVTEALAEREREAGHLRTALITRELIGQAQGILMERERLTAQQAFDVLRRASQHFNVKLALVAQRLVDTGERPLPPDVPVRSRAPGRAGF